MKHIRLLLVFVVLLLGLVAQTTVVLADPVCLDPTTCVSNPLEPGDGGVGG